MYSWFSIMFGWASYVAYVFAIGSAVVHMLHKLQHIIPCINIKDKSNPMIEQNEGNNYKNTFSFMSQSTLADHLFLFIKVDKHLSLALGIRPVFITPERFSS